MRIGIWPHNVANNGIDLYRQLAGYINKTDTIVENSLDCDAALIWSVLWYGRMAGNHKVWQHYRKQNKPVIVIEVGGLVRNKTWRLSINGINRSAIFPTIEKLNYDRPKMLNLSILPWHSGDYVLICGQHGKSEQWQDMPTMDDYFKQTVLKIRQYTQRPIVIRSHPRYRENIFFKIDPNFYKHHQVEWNIPKQIQQTYDSFDLEPLLAHCHCTISHSSNSGISSILSGTPAIVSNESLAYEVSSSNLENLSMPDREQWLVELSHKEWFEEELEQAWINLRPNLLL